MTPNAFFRHSNHRIPTKAVMPERIRRPMIGILICLINIFQSSMAQNPRVDSLLAALPAMKDDTNKIHTLIDLSYHFLGFSDYARANTYLQQLHELSNRLNHKWGISVYYAHSGLISYYQGDDTAALENLRIALQLSEELRSRKRIADNYTNIGMVLTRQGNYADAIQSYNSALGFRDADDRRGTSATYTNLGIVYHQLGDYPNALNYYLLSLEIDEELGENLDLAFSYNNLGLFYQAQKRNSEAISYIQKANMLCQKLGHQECIAGTNSNLANLYKEQGNYQEALEYHMGSLLIFRQIGNTGEIASTYGNIGVLYHLMGKDSLALEYHQSALTVHKEMGNKRGVATALHNLGEVCMALNKYNDAGDYLENSLQISKEIGAKELVEASYRDFARLDSLRGDFLQALVHFGLSTVYRDSVLNERNQEFIAELEKKFASEKKDKEILKLESEREITALQLQVKNEMLRKAQSDKERLSAENLWSEQHVLLLKMENKLKELEIKEHKSDMATQMAVAERKEKELALLAKQAEIKNIALRKQRLLNYYLLGGFGLLLALAFVLYNNYLIRQRLKLQTLRNKIASDLHDDVGSTLSSISIFSEMAQKQSRDIIPALQTIGESSRKMLDAMADIVWTINPENDQFDKILMRMRSFAYELLGAKKIDFVFKAEGDVEKIKLPMDVRKNLFLIFKEATNNMVKYAEASKASYSIKNEDAHLVMMIHDNGKGFDTGKPTEGNGLRNMRKRAEEIGGLLSIDSVPGNGTTVQLKIAV